MQKNGAVTKTTFQLARTHEGKWKRDCKLQSSMPHAAKRILVTRNPKKGKRRKTNLLGLWSSASSNKRHLKGILNPIGGLQAWNSNDYPLFSMAFAISTKQTR